MRGCKQFAVGAVLAISVALTTTAAAADLQHVLAQELGVDARNLIPNLPPRPGCLPGSIFTDDLKIPLERTSPADAALDRGVAFSLDADAATLAGGGGGGGIAGLFGLAASYRASTNATLNVAKGVVIDMLGPQLKTRLLASAAAKSAANRGHDPFIVSRAYEGSVTVTIGRKAGGSAEAWAKLKTSAAQANLNGEMQGDSRLVFRIPGRFVFAFEVVQGKYLITHLGGIGPTDVRLIPIRADEFQR